MHMEEDALFETMRWAGGISLLEGHLHRLGRSASALGYPYDEAGARSLLDEHCRDLDDAVPRRIRMTLGADGRLTVRISECLSPSRETLQLIVATERLNSSDPLLRHKTTRRTIQERAYARAVEAGYDEALFLNERQEVCEGSRTNMMMRLNGRLLTPTLGCGLLPGVYREYLLQVQPELNEAVLNAEDLLQAEELYVCNAVWGLRRAVLAPESALQRL